MLVRYLLPIFLSCCLFSCSPKKTATIKNDDNTNVKSHTATAKQFIAAVKKEDPSSLSNIILYPMSRQHPLPDVVDSKDFVNRYDEIFDKRLKKMIVESDPAKDWSMVGSKGIMLGSGDVWIDYSGQLIAINYESATERTKREKIEEIESSGLHASLTDFQKNLVVMKTESYLLRVDNLGDYNFRLAYWPSDGAVSNPPKFVIENGSLLPEGSGGNHRYIFKDVDRSYQVWVTPLGAKHSAHFVIMKDGEELENEGDIEFKN